MRSRLEAHELRRIAVQGAKAAEKELGLVEKGFVVDFQRGDFTDKRQIEMLTRMVSAQAADRPAGRPQST